MSAPQFPRSTSSSKSLTPTPQHQVTLVSTGCHTDPSHFESSCSHTPAWL